MRGRRSAIYVDTRIGSRWSRNEDSLLKALVDSHGNDWELISDIMNKSDSSVSRTATMVKNRWSLVFEQGQTQGPWSIEEDKIIQDSVALGIERWADIAKRIPGFRSAKQCRERWQNHLDPQLKKTQWTPHEDSALVQLQQSFGNAWSRIAQELPGRSENDIKNRWYSVSRKRAYKLLGDAAAGSDSPASASPAVGTKRTGSVWDSEKESEGVQKLHIQHEHMTAESRRQTTEIGVVSTAVASALTVPGFVLVTVTQRDLLALQIADHFLSALQMSRNSGLAPLNVAKSINQSTVASGASAGEERDHTPGTTGSGSGSVERTTLEDAADSLDVFKLAINAAVLSPDPPEVNPTALLDFDSSLFDGINSNGLTYSGMSSPLSMLADLSLADLSGGSRSASSLFSFPSAFYSTMNDSGSRKRSNNSSKNSHSGGEMGTGPSSCSNSVIVPSNINKDER